MATVLVVDDEFGIGDLLEGILTDEGHHVVVASNGHQALERLADTRVDLIISDLMMPVMDGAGLLRGVRRDSALDGVPFLLMCALPEDAIADRISGHDGFLQKPFRTAEVLAAVEEALRNKRSGDG
jgi:DNA-binding response OmpR family regulator